ncbi:MAG: ABC transporter substrate-binding protein [Acidimicrobiia bacterium]
MTVLRPLSGLLVAVLLAAGCGDDDGDAASASAPSDGGTRSFVDVYGEEIEVPGDAQRIVAIHDSNGGEQLLSLGAELIGFPSRGGEFVEEITDVYDLDGVADVGEVYEPNIEAIAALEPDLIVGEGYDGAGMDQFMDAGVHERLLELAPVVYIDTFRPVDEVIADFAELVGPDAEAEYEEQRTAYDDDLDAVREELGDPAGLSVSIVQFAPDQLTVHGDQTLVPSVILDSLGIERPAITEEADAEGGFLSLSLERIPEVDADLILLDMGVGEFGGDHTDNPLWQALAAVQADQVHPYDSSWYGTTYHRFQLVLDELGPVLVGADRDVLA